MASRLLYVQACKQGDAGLHAAEEVAMSGEGWPVVCGDGCQTDEEYHRADERETRQRLVMNVVGGWRQKGSVCGGAGNGKKLAAGGGRLEKH